LAVGQVGWTGNLKRVIEYDHDLTDLRASPKILVTIKFGYGFRGNLMTSIVMHQGPNGAASG
jgi:hypothetical protein